jgi:acetylornithine/N-succinyldiaminopimelate aminotransferase
MQELSRILDQYSDIFEELRGEGLMLGLKCKVDNMELIETGYDQKLLLIPAADNVIRILPPLNITDQEIREGINRIETIAASFQEKIK